MEATLPAKPQQVYPVCTAGKYVYSPQDCSGVEDYLAERCLLLQTQEQDMEVLSEFAVQVAQRQPDDPALGLAQDSEEYAALVLAVERTQSRECLAAERFDRHAVNRQLRVLSLSGEVNDAVRDPEPRPQ